jgi:hypothetical protein
MFHSKLGKSLGSKCNNPAFSSAKKISILLGHWECPHLFRIEAATFISNSLTKARQSIYFYISTLTIP